MADALASGASVLYGRGGSSPPSPTICGVETALTGDYERTAFMISGCVFPATFLTRQTTANYAGG